MLYLLHGSDFKKSREKAHSLVDFLLKKKPNTEFFKIDSVNFSKSKIEELIGGQGLFQQKYIVLADGLLEHQDILELVEEIAQSENIFVFIEENVAKLVLKKIEKVAEKIQEFDQKEVGGRIFGVMGGGELALKDFNIFDIADAFGRRDKKELWVLYQKAKIRNIPDEEMYGILLWQIKSILTAQKSKNLEESGLKPFVYNKSLRFAKNFKEGEIENFSSKLISIYHDSRRGLCDFEIAMEKFILE